jgi:Protein of unknown function (DUF642)
MLRGSIVGMAVLAALAGSEAKANLITNGSFDASPPFKGGKVVFGDAISGWSIAPGYGVLWISSGFFGGLKPSPGNGSNYLIDLTGMSDTTPFEAVSQTIMTTPGATYQLTFDLGSAIQWGIQDGVTVSAGATSQTFTSTNDGTSINNWDSEVFDFTASSASTLITLAGASGNQYIGVNNVSVVETGVPGTPETSTWAMMMLGFAGLGFAGWRSSRETVAARA